MPTVQVLYFATLRDRRGRSSESVQVAAGTTLAELYASLFPVDRVPVAYARNAAYAKGDTQVQDGDEVCFLPPLGGG